jgi:hypothetical protein
MAIEFYSELYVDESGKLIELVDFGNEKYWYFITGLSEHTLFGIFFCFKAKI